MGLLEHMLELVFYFKCEDLKLKSHMIWFTFRKDQLKCHVRNSMGCQEQKEERRDKSYYNNQGKGGQGHRGSSGIFTGDCQKSKDVGTHTCCAIVLSMCLWCCSGKSVQNCHRDWCWPWHPQRLIYWVVVNLVHFFLVSGCLMGSIDQPGNLLQRRKCVGLSR